MAWCKQSTEERTLNTAEKLEFILQYLDIGMGKCGICKELEYKNVLLKFLLWFYYFKQLFNKYNNFKTVTKISAFLLKWKHVRRLTDPKYEGCFSIHNLFGYYLRHKSKLRETWGHFYLILKHAGKNISWYFRESHFDVVPTQSPTTVWTARCILDYWFLLLWCEHLQFCTCMGN